MNTPVSDADVDALAARLRAEIEATAEGSDAGAPQWVASRREAGRLAPVSGDRPFYRRPGTWGRVRSALITAPKAATRKLTRWYVEPIASDQSAFNGAMLRLADDITAWTAAGMHDVRARLDELVAQLERT